VLKTANLPIHNLSVKKLGRNRIVNKKWISLGLAFVLGTSSVISVSAQDFDAKKAKINQERSSVQSDINSKKSEIEELEAKEKEINAQINQLDQKLTETGNKIHEKEMQIEETKAKIEELRKQIEELQKRIEERNELLKERARSLQESGGAISYIDVLLGAKSFSDFISRITAVTTLVEADKQIMEEHQRDKQLKEEAEANLTKELNELSQALTELQTLRKQLDAQIEEKNKLLNDIREEQEHAMEELEELEDQEAFLAEQARIIEQQKREYERQLAEQRRKAQQGQSSSPSSSSSAKGDFIWPTAGVVTSGYGARWGSIHHGIDIAKRGTVPVYAAASGTVIRSYYSSSYGNVVFISHNINGQVYTTVYAHLSSRAVSSGQRVSQGQFLGYMGNTGRSYGQHLHFEVHRGPWNGGKTNSINPLSVLP